VRKFSKRKASRKLSKETKQQTTTATQNVMTWGPNVVVKQQQKKEIKELVAIFSASVNKWAG